MATQELLVPGYHLLERVGAGRSGEVYRARSADSDEIVALKISHPTPRHGSEDLEFKLEYHLHSLLDHPHVLRARRFGELDEYRRFYVMDYVPAVPLTEIHENHGLAALGEIAFAVGTALEYAHAQGTLHSDIKPANILVSTRPDGTPDRILLADFGHARHLGQDAGASLLGTPAYIAPEELHGWRADPRSDLYSLGVTLFEAISGRLPHAADTVDEQLRALAEFRQLSLEELVPGIDPRWSDFVASLMARRPEDRPRSATEAVERLVEILDEGGGSAPRRTGASSLLGRPQEIVGRGEELERLARLFRDSGSVRTVLVTGHEGVGKTRLIEEFGKTVELEGVRVYRADAHEARGGFGLVKSIRHLGGARDFTGAAPRAATGDKQAALERLADDLLHETETSDSERVYVFDSLEAADRDSLALLRVLQGRIASSNGFLILALRTLSDLPDAIAEEFRSPETAELRLLPLDAAGTRQLVHRQLGMRIAGIDGTAAADLESQDLGRLVQWVHQETGGIPRLVETSLRTLADNGHLEPGPDGWTVKPGLLEKGAVPVTARERAERQRSGFRPDRRHYLELASAFGAEFDGTVLAAAEDFDADVASAFLTDAALAGVLARIPGAGARYRFTDPEAGRALYESLSPEDRQDLHRRIAAHLESGGGPPGARVAEHWDLAGEPDRAAAGYVRAGQENLAASAFEEAEHCFRRAWELRGDDATDHPGFAEAWVTALHANGDFEGAVETAALVLEGATGDDDEVSGLLVRQAQCLGELGRREEAQRVLAPLVEPDGEADLGHRVQALIQYARFEAYANRKDSAREHLLRARDLASANNRLFELGQAELNLGILCFRDDDFERALEWHARAHEHFIQSERNDLLPAVWGNQAVCHWFLLDARRAAASHRRAADEYLRQH
ncbi:MAG: protein kinase, partial [Gemmatimonadetes bacterium]|nr:protein kinase [Gemmatimonadota bacterium]